MPPLASNASDNVKKQAAREVIDILHEIAVLLVCFVFVGELDIHREKPFQKSSFGKSTRNPSTRRNQRTNTPNHSGRWIADHKRHRNVEHTTRSPTTFAVRFLGGEWC